MIIDSHQHFWSVSDGRYDYPRPGDGVIYRDFGPADLADQLPAAGVGRTIAVQAVEATWETEYLLGLSRSTDFVAGVVGWCDLRSPDARDVLAGYLGIGRLVGIRPMLQKQDDASWLLSGAAAETLAWVAQAGLAFDALVDARHLAVVDRLAAHHPDLPIVIDHMAKPWRLPERMADWSDGIRQAARHPNCSVKISGFPFSGAGEDQEHVELCRSLRDWFGPDRLIWGSDWPVSTRHVAYAECVSRARARFSDAEWQMIGHANAERVYGLGPDGDVPGRS